MRKNTKLLDAIIIATKQDILQDYDISDEVQLKMANEELIASFNNNPIFSKSDKEYLLEHLFTTRTHNSQ